jgi:hypothetical protein
MVWSYLAFFVVGLAFFSLLDDACRCSSLLLSWFPAANSIVLGLILVTVICGVEANLEAFNKSPAFGTVLTTVALFCNLPF